MIGFAYQKEHPDQHAENALDERADFKSAWPVWKGRAQLKKSQEVLRVTQARVDTDVDVWNGENWMNLRSVLEVGWICYC